MTLLHLKAYFCSVNAYFINIKQRNDSFLIKILYEHYVESLPHVYTHFKIMNHSQNTLSS